VIWKQFVETVVRMGAYAREKVSKISKGLDA
jgi:hypothetical protein